MSNDKVQKALEQFSDQKSEQRAIGFTIWAISYWDCNDFTAAPTWAGMWRGKVYQRISTKKLYSIYLQRIKDKP